MFETVTVEEPDLEFAVVVKPENVDPVHSSRLAVNVQSADLWCWVSSSQLAAVAEELGREQLVLEFHHLT